LNKYNHISIAHILNKYNHYSIAHVRHLK